jgi:hypothetical protein
MNKSAKCDDKHSVTLAPVDLIVDNNGSWSDAFQFGDLDDTSWNLIGCTFELDVQRNAYDLVPLLSLSSANGRILIADPVQRVIYFDVDAVDLQAGLQPGAYVYDLVMTDQLGVRTPLMGGILEVVQGVTYPP